MNFQSRALTNIHDHSLAISGWRQAYRQITPGRFSSTLVQAQSSDFHFFRETTNRRIAQQGVSPPGLSSVAVPLLEPLAGTFQDQLVNGYAVLMLGGNEEFQFYTPEKMHFICISIPTDTLAELIDATFGEQRTVRLPRHVIRFGEGHGAILRDRLSPYLDSVERNPDALALPAAEKIFRNEVLSVLLDVMASATGGDRHDLTHSTYSDIVRRCERLVRADAEEPVTVLDLCCALRCSRRTLQTSFQRVANVSPVSYLRSIRLNAIHRLLRSTHPEELQVSDAAARWGFTHLSYFAQEYRELFGELPSHTARRS
jgi:AraC family ethanolamine operon transcriptional activator